MKSSLLGPLGRIAAATCSVVGVLGIALLAMSTPASAAPLTVTFSTPEVGQSWVVPAGVTSVSFTLYGAIGGSGDVAGGDGAKVTGTLTLTAGTTMAVAAVAGAMS